MELDFNEPGLGRLDPPSFFTGHTFEMVSVLIWFKSEYRTWFWSLGDLSAAILVQEHHRPAEFPN